MFIVPFVVPLLFLDSSSSVISCCLNFEILLMFKVMFPLILQA